MVKLKIDNREVKAGDGALLMDVIRGTGTEVPSMCWLQGLPAFASCMVCVVKDRQTGNIIPSCAMKAEEGMDIITDDEEVLEARRTALELLLSEHVGDCEAPCQVTCPAHMDIPLMNRLLAEGKFGEALQVVKKDIALPAVLGRICPAPCEGACRRKSVDEAVSICLLKRYAGDHDLVQDESWIPERAAETGKRVTVIGAGPAGLAAAYHLALKGHDCTVVDRNSRAGGSICKEVPEEELPPEVLQKEIDLIEKSGVSFSLGKDVDAAAFDRILKENDAVVVATGRKIASPQEWGLPLRSQGEKVTGINADSSSYRVEERNLFVVGSALKASKLAIRALGQGKEVAFSVDQFLAGRPVTGEKFLFNSRFGKLVSAEFSEYLKESHEGKRLEPSVPADGFTPEQVMEEAARCLHCDCRDMYTCRLRIYSDRYDAQQKRFKPETRSVCTKVDQHDMVIYEPSKCIKCGICVRMTEKHSEKFGMTFIGRGFEVEVGIPFSEPLKNGLTKVALEVADACPTGAIAKKV